MILTGHKSMKDFENYIRLNKDKEVCDLVDTLHDVILPLTEKTEVKKEVATLSATLEIKNP